MAHIYGVNSVFEALRAQARPIERVMVAQGVRHHRLQELIQFARQQGVPVQREPRVALDRLTGTANHQGVLAVVAAARYADAYELIEKAPEQTIFVLLDGIEDPHNLGAIIRTAECAGAAAVILPERRSAQLTETVVKTSAGATEYLPVARVPNLGAFSERLKKRGFWIVGVESSAEKDYAAQDYSGKVALVFGAEGHGLGRLLKERCDFVVSVPMRGRIGSLNVSVAVGVVLFEAVRQRQTLDLRP